MTGVSLLQRVRPWSAFPSFHSHKHVSFCRILQKDTGDFLLCKLWYFFWKWKKTSIHWLSGWLWSDDFSKSGIRWTENCHWYFSAAEGCSYISVASSAIMIWWFFIAYHWEGLKIKEKMQSTCKESLLPTQKFNYWRKGIWWGFNIMKENRLSETDNG